MENQALNSKALNLIMEAKHSFFRKDDQRKNLHDPLYLWQHGYVPDTPLMRVVVKDIMFCSYQYQPINSDNYLISDGTDYEKLKRISSYDYGINIDVERYFASHRLFRLMQYIEKNISEENRKAVLDREQQERNLANNCFSYYATVARDALRVLTVILLSSTSISKSSRMNSIVSTTSCSLHPSADR